MQRGDHQDDTQGQADRDGDGESLIGSDGELSSAWGAGLGRLSWGAYSRIVAAQRNRDIGADIT
jgi:hypothetical protein